MATTTRHFDPYHKWLGIPPHQQPPNYYRLLRISLYESDPQVIENAYNREMADLKTQEYGQHVDLVEKLSRELFVARRCLLNPENKAAYDAALRKELNAEKDGHDSAADLAHRVALDQAVQQAKAQKTAELNRLRAEAQQAEERERQASTLVQNLRSELARLQQQTRATRAAARQPPNRQVPSAETVSQHRQPQTAPRGTKESWSSALCQAAPCSCC